MAERNEAQKAADKLRERLREHILRLPRGLTVDVWTSADVTSGNLPFDRQTLRGVGVGRVPEVRMLAAQIGMDRHGYADLEVGARPVRALFFLNVDEVELRGVTLEEGQNEWLGMMDDVRRWARGVTVDELIRADQEGWARAVEAESARAVLPFGDIKVYRSAGPADPNRPTASEVLDDAFRAMLALDGVSLEESLADLKRRADDANPWLPKYQNEPASESKP